MARTNILDVFVSQVENPHSAADFNRQIASKALALLETIYLYAPDGRRLIEACLGTEIDVSTEKVDSVEWPFSVKVNGDAA